MAGADVGTFTVTPESLLDLSRRVSMVRSDLDSTKDFVDDIAEALGSRTVVAALDSFVSGWRDGRKQISGEVAALSEMLAQAANVYSETDATIASAIPVGAR